MKNKIIQDSEQPLGRMFSLIGKTYLTVLNSRLNALDIERNFYALLLIDQSDGQITQQELSNMLEIDKVTMLRSIDYLATNGYVERQTNASDRRKYSLTLTNKARKALPEIKKSFSQINDIAMQGLSETQRIEFYNSLEIIKTNLNEYNSTI